MTPVEFPESNAVYGPPEDLEKSQCMDLQAWRGKIQGGSVDGALAVVTCWKPDERELELLKSGRPLFLTFLGGLPPHYISMSFEEATRPA